VPAARKIRNTSESNNIIKSGCFGGLSEGGKRAARIVAIPRSYRQNQFKNMSLHA
jgi:hypothetical protein